MTSTNHFRGRHLSRSLSAPLSPRHKREPLGLPPDIPIIDCDFDLVFNGTNYIQAPHRFDFAPDGFGNYVANAQAFILPALTDAFWIAIPDPSFTAYSVRITFNEGAGNVPIFEFLPNTWDGLYPFDRTFTSVFNLNADSINSTDGTIHLPTGP